jgi:hypothetical protein
MRRRGQIPIVDMKRSGIKKEEWKKYTSADITVESKKKHQYVPISYKDVSTDIRPPWKFKWNKNTEEAIRNDKANWEYTPVTVDDGYWPEGIPPDSKNCFTRGDLIFSKVPLEVWIEQELFNLKRAGVGRKVTFEQFQNQCRHVGAEVSEEELNEALGL